MKIFIDTGNINEIREAVAMGLLDGVTTNPSLVAKAGKPLVKVCALDTPAAAQRLGFLAGEISVPDDFDRMGEREIES